MFDDLSFQNDFLLPRKTLDPFNTIDMALKVEAEKTRAKEALAARDTAIQHLADACASIRQKTELIAALQHRGNKNDGSSVGTPVTHTPKPIFDISMEMVVEKTMLMREIEELQSAKERLQAELTKIEGTLATFAAKEISRPIMSRVTSYTSSVSDAGEIEFKLNPLIIKTADASDIIKARNDILAALPLPDGIPDDALKPIILPPPFTLHEFLGNATGSLRSSLSNYRVFQQLTTSWCPDREEHGYMLTPVFKCSTNPRVATAHRWMTVDILGRMNKPAECFYNKDGKWYYAGVYKPFRLDDLTTKEWESLSTETTQAIIKETIAGRKNTSPQNVYETTQLYAAGALKVGCIGLQCIGFNAPMYRAILEQANKCAQNGKWKVAQTTTPPAVGGSVGLGVRGASWNRDVVDEMGSMHLGRRSADGAENVPIGGDQQQQRSLRTK